MKDSGQGRILCPTPLNGANAWTSQVIRETASTLQAHPRILAIRHGESEWNVLHRKYPTQEERYHPRMWAIDCGLAERGVDQAKQAGLELVQQTLPDGVDLLVVSPLRRALDTAQHIVHEYHNHKRESKLATKIPLVQISKDAAEVMCSPVCGPM